MKADKECVGFLINCTKEISQVSKIGQIVDSHLFTFVNDKRVLPFSGKLVSLHLGDKLANALTSI